VDGVELGWLETGNPPPGNAAPRTPAGRRLFEYMAGKWDGENFEAIMTELFPLVLENIQKLHAESASESEATFVQQDGLQVDTSASNLAFSHLENRLGNPARNVSAFAATSIQQDGLPVDTSVSNPVAPHDGNTLELPAQNAESGPDVPENLIAVAQGGTEAFHGNGPQPRPDHIYTSLLKMHGDQVGQVPQYTQRQLTDFPPVWSCTATFNGRSAAGQGRNVRVAKHEASRQLYNQLGLE